ncbi:PilC/PilY family type IV pilus protein [Schlegelella sp. S2-27]|uniref:PilC/PilY family type IV pilus protein n=1 Tax=Caldimonas mangrovi TaxID=2944811 RepID=A0ABT0YLS2_9BURK|nr:PilC/PilY family type IV pilus protein [Caldimonas mangrovi]MCM5679660.1 PilC/PilY family type IV pilus protein [Caldimonas mangrovi]
MNASTKQAPRRVATGRAVTVLAAVLSGLQAVPAWAAPSQMPFLTRTSNPAHPNIVYTLDDSGSMQWQFMPDSSLPNNVESYSMAFHHQDRRARVLSDNSSYNPQVIPTRTNDLIAARMRSPAWNTVYYNPEIRYHPWYSADGTQFEPANPRAAWIYPTNRPAVGTSTQQTNAINNGLAVNLIGEIEAPSTVEWCRSNRNGNANNTGTGDANRTGATCGTLSGQERYAPATYYLLNGANNNYTNFTRYRIMDATSFTRGPGRTDCSVSGSTATCTQAQEYQNFANWFTYYRTRQFLALGASSQAFAGLEADAGLRVGYGKINKGQTTVDGRASTGTLERGVRRFTGTDREAFFTWLHGQGWSTQGTPLKRAMDDIGQYYSWTDSRGAWGNTPGTTDTSAALECRKSYHILMTDGYANETGGARSSSRTGDFDGVSGPTVTGPGGASYQYTPSRPYMSAGGGTLADLAMYYWNRDLHGTLGNRVRPDATNPAFWQHMVNFTVGLGVGGTLTYPDDLAAITAGTEDWPTVQNNHPTTVDDLWHAAVNSRGRYLSARDPEQFASALSGILQEIIDREASEGGVAAAAATLQAGNRKYVPTYRTGAWTGNLTAYELDASGQQLGEVWNAEAALPAHADRNIFVGTRGTAAPRAVEFTWDTLPAAMRTELGAGASAALVNYLRGDASQEGTTYRRRNARLGDFVNSQPLYVGGLVDMHYQNLPTGTAGRDSYRSFVTAKAARTGAIFVGGNDGMLHAFSNNTGRETFAFIPRALLSSLPVLASSSYTHRYFVDGQQTESDAYFSGSWRNVVVGSTGAGARAVYALDTTNMTSMGASNVLWEFDSTVNAELGHVMAPVEVGLMKNGQWAAIFGNGPDSASGNARLFIVNLSTGALMAEIQAGTATGNGLGGVRLIRDGNRVVVGAYAGDLQGNVWKFDLASTTSSGWRVAYSGNPLYRALDAANNPQPIMAAPQYVNHPRGGYMVLVGTGKLYEEGDQTSTQRQTLYGLWDQQVLTLSGTTWGWSSADRITSSTSIVNQSIDTTTISGAGDTVYYTVTTTPLDWTLHRGWSLPLTIVAGQRNLLSPQFLFGYTLFETMSPSAEGVLNPCEDANSGVAVNMLLNPLNGAMPAVPIFDTNGDGVVNSSDQIVAGAHGGGWDGRDVILRQAGCAQLGQCSDSGGSGDPNGDGPCGAGQRRFVISGASGANASTCLPLPTPERWWWRQLTE